MSWLGQPWHADAFPASSLSVPGQCSGTSATGVDMIYELLLLVIQSTIKKIYTIYIGVEWLDSMIGLFCYQSNAICNDTNTSLLVC